MTDTLVDQAQACHYFSTWCIHGFHASAGPHGCRGTCKFCESPCRCPCHAGTKPTPEQVARQYDGLRRGLENLLVGIEARRAFADDVMNEPVVAQENAVIADAIRGILDNPTAALDD